MQTTITTKTTGGPFGNLGTNNPILALLPGMYKALKMEFAWAKKVSY